MNKIIPLIIASLLVSSVACKQEQVAQTDVIDCAKAELTTIEKGKTVVEVAMAVVEAIAAGPAAVVTEVTALITKYGSDIVACAVDAYPEAVGSGSASPTISMHVQLKHSLLQQFWAGKKIKH